MKKIMSLVLMGLLVCMSASVMGGAVVYKVKKSEATCLDLSDGYKICSYSMIIDSSIETESGIITNIKTITKYETYNAEGKLVDKETQITAYNDHAEMIVAEAIISVIDGEIDTCKTTLKSSDGDPLFDHSIGDCPTSLDEIQ